MATRTSASTCSPHAQEQKRTRAAVWFHPPLPVSAIPGPIVRAVGIVHEQAGERNENGTNKMDASRRVLVVLEMASGGATDAGAAAGCGAKWIGVVAIFTLSLSWPHIFPLLHDQLRAHLERARGHALALLPLAN